MKLRHSLSIFGLVAMLGMGVGVGLASAQKPVAEVRAAAGDRTSTHQFVGEALGIGWNNGANENYQFIEQANGTFTWKGHFSAGLFRVTKPGTWDQNRIGGDELGEGAGGAFVDNDDGDNNIKCLTAGYYCATLNSTKTSISFAAIDPEFGLIGSFAGHEWNYDETMVVNTTAKTATLSSFALAKGDVFKVRAFGQWAEEYGWDNASGHISVTDEWDRGEDCFGHDSQNITVLHDGTYSIVLNYSTYELSITGARAEYDTEVTFRIFISNDGGSSYVPTTMELKPESSTEYMLTRDFAAGELFYFRFGSYYYHYSDLKDGCALADKQFVQTGEDGEALYHGNYTVYFETEAGDSWGLWLQYNSVSSAQERSNVISYATYFNDQVGGVCDPQGQTTVISDLQTAWSNVKAKYDNAPTDGIRNAIKAATGEDENAEVSEFVGKYNSVYYLRGSSLSSQGGDFLAKEITPKSSVGMPTIVGADSQSNPLVIIIAISGGAVLALIGGYFYFRKRKEDR